VSYGSFAEQHSLDTLLYRANGEVRNRAPMTLDDLKKALPDIVLTENPAVIVEALTGMNVWEEVKAAGRVNYSRNSSLSRNAPLVQGDDAACEWMRLAPSALVKKLTLADPAPVGIGPRLHAYGQSTAQMGKELNKLWEQGASHEQVWLEFVSRATKHFSVVQADNYVRELDNYCITPCVCPLDQVKLDLMSRCRTALSLVPDPVGKDATKHTTLRCIRAIGQFFNLQAPMLQVALQLATPSMMANPEAYTLEQIWAAMDLYGQNEFTFAPLPARAAGLRYVFTPQGVEPAAGAAPAARSEHDRHSKTTGAPAEDRRKKGHYTMTVNLQSKDEVALQAAVYLAFLELNVAVVDQQRGGCYNCGGHDHYFLDCKADYKATSWDALVRERAGAAKWRPTSNAMFRSMQERLQSMRSEAGNGGKKQRFRNGGGRGGGGRGRGGN
jgi:hypothetical protein